MIFDVTVFESKYNNSFCKTIIGNCLEEAVDDEVRIDWESDVMSVKHTHYNVLEFRYKDGTISYSVYSPITEYDKGKDYDCPKTLWAR